MCKLPEASYIFIAKDDTKHLLQYDPVYKHTQTHDLSSILPNHFKGTSTCMLPSSLVLLAGGCDDEYYSDTYIFSIKTQTLHKVASMNYLRNRVTLFYHSNFVYAFGGECYDTLKYSERYNLQNNRWEVLPEMAYPRYTPFCLAIGNKIYILAGGSNSIEMFHIPTLKFHTIPITLSTDNVVALVNNQRIYLLEHKTLKIFTDSFQLLSTHPHSFENYYSSLSNVLVSSYSVRYYDDYLDSIIEVYI